MSCVRQGVRVPWLPGSTADVISVTVLLLIGTSGDGTLGTAVSSEVVAMGMTLVIVVGVMVAVAVAVAVVVLAGAAASTGAGKLPLLCVLSGL